MPTTKNKRTKNPHICVPASQSRSPVDSRAASGKAGAASALSVSPSRTGEAYGNRPPGASWTAGRAQRSAWQDRGEQHPIREGCWPRRSLWTSQWWSSCWNCCYCCCCWHWCWCCSWWCCWRGSCCFLRLEVRQTSLIGMGVVKCCGASVVWAT